MIKESLGVSQEKNVRHGEESFPPLTMERVDLARSFFEKKSGNRPRQIVYADERAWDNTQPPTATRTISTAVRTPARMQYFTRIITHLRFHIFKQLREEKITAGNQIPGCSVDSEVSSSLVCPYPGYQGVPCVLSPMVLFLRCCS